MAKLIYFISTSLDGYVADESGNFDWGEPTEEVHTFINDQLRPIGTYLHGRKVYELMTYWETAHEQPDEPPVIYDFANMWQAAEKVVYSRTLKEVSSAKTRIEREFDPAAIRQMKEDATADIVIGGPELTAHALRAGLVDEIQLRLVPIIIGGGNPFLPKDVRLELELLEERTFADGGVWLRYRTS